MHRAIIEALGVVVVCALLVPAADAASKPVNKVSCHGATCTDQCTTQKLATAACLPTNGGSQLTLCNATAGAIYIYDTADCSGAAVWDHHFQVGRCAPDSADNSTSTIYWCGDVPANAPPGENRTAVVLGVVFGAIVLCLLVAVGIKLCKMSKGNGGGGVSASRYGEDAAAAYSNIK